MKKVPNGIEFPISGGNRRSTLDFNKKCWIASIEGVSKEEDRVRIEREKNFRFNYGKYVTRHVEICCKSPEICEDVCQKGLDYVYENIEFHRDGKVMKMDEAFESCDEGFFTGVYSGKLRSRREFGVPYKGKYLRGESLIRKMKDWVEKGVCEVECVRMMRFMIDNHQKIDLSNTYFVLLGATSAMGPMEVLLSLGANVVAIARKSFKKWKNIEKICENSSGRLYFPTSVDPNDDEEEEDIANHAGADLLTETPEIYNWIDSVVPKSSELIVGNYTYGDGQLYVKLSIACDSIMKHLSVGRDHRDMKISFYGSPGNVHPIKEETKQGMRDHFKTAPYWQKLLYFLLISSNRHLTKNEREDLLPDGKGSEKTYPYCYGIGVMQGPNYILAKRIQVWRSVVMYQSRNACVSNIQAPPSRTYSVLHSWKFEAYMGGMEWFSPLEVFTQSCSKHVMAGLLFYDLFDPSSPANPENTSEYSSPLEVICTTGSFHGGIWRCGFQGESVAGISSLIHFFKFFVLEKLLFLPLMFILWMVGGTTFFCYVMLVLLSGSLYLFISFWLNHTKRWKRKWKD